MENEACNRHFLVRKWDISWANQTITRHEEAVADQKLELRL